MLKNLKQLHWPSLTLVFCVAAAAVLGADDSPIGETEGLPVVGWEEAREVVGRQAVVVGKIVDVGHTSRIHFLNFSKTDRSAFKLVVFQHAMDRFSEPLETYLNQLVEVRGIVSLYAGGPQIVVGQPNQIRIVERLPPTVMPKRSKITLGDEVTIASYNVLNLFDSVDDPYRGDESTRAKPRDELEQMAASIRQLDADVVALQEVENRGYLQRFLDVFLSDMGYRHVVHFEGNDLRGIDVCVVSRVPIGRVTSHRHLRFPDDRGHWRAFNRDLLRVELLPPGGDPFEVWVVHLKSNSGGREAAEPIRLAEARQVRKLIEDRLREDPGAAFVLCGDFNDTFDSATLKAITGGAGGDATTLQALFESVPEVARVTYNREPYRSMIDFMLCSPAMADRYVPNSYQIRGGTQEETGSDHNPVLCRFYRQATNRSGQRAAPARAVD